MPEVMRVAETIQVREDECFSNFDERVCTVKFCTLKPLPLR